MSGVKEGAARAVLRDVLRNGHETVELRQDGKRLIFFCNLCCTRCYSDASLLDHLNGNLHSKRYAAAKISFLASPPWPFNDGVSLAFPSSSSKFGNNTSLALESSSSVNQTNSETNSPYQWVGCGHAYMRASHPHPAPSVKAVWCYWMGQTQNRPSSQENSVPVPVCDCDYGILTFRYTHTLGRGAMDTSPSLMDIDEIRKRKKRRGRPPRLSLHPFLQSSSSIEKSQTQSQSDSEIGVSVSNKGIMRKGLDRLCFICHQQMLPGKDVAALLNIKTGLIACSSRNRRGAFHVFHTSCLIDWVLLCETKIWLSRSKRSRRSSRLSEKSSRAQKANGSIFCPECQGTGVKTRCSKLEVPRYKLAQVFEWILELIQSRKSWIDHPEQLKQCATGLLFSPSDNQGSILSLFILHFYTVRCSELSLGSTANPQGETLAVTTND
eukprot:TRINITY_DN30978_c0_g1_i1.p1 TRINITY_DN30978_c0_g1~~TRINITY_DN30978_c0_g1_i1.p1  ORF type:complete len:438 (+),score=50.32 TRINITY_DN30978_c0_g1_i1:435-1748(+)